jgi:signal transduction histidine kinase
VAIPQLLVELMVNAMESIQAETGRVTVRTRPLAETAGVRVEILDSGAGIPEDLISTIYEPFFTTKGTLQSTGLGLAVVYGIVESHKGTIVCQSKLNVGTTFTIDFPVEKPDRDGRDDAPARPVKGGDAPPG